MMMIEDFKKDTNNQLLKRQKPLKEESQKPLKELQENTIKEAKEMNKTIQDLKMEVEKIKKKSQKETNLELENLEKRLGVIDASITNRLQETEETISGAEDSRENIDTKIK